MGNQDKYNPYERRPWGNDADLASRMAAKRAREAQEAERKATEERANNIVAGLLGNYRIKRLGS